MYFNHVLLETLHSLMHYIAVLRKSKKDLFVFIHVLHRSCGFLGLHSASWSIDLRLKTFFTISTEESRMRHRRNH